MAVNDVECCETYCVHADKLKVVNENMPEEDEMYDLAELFKVFGDSTRVKLLFALSSGEKAVGELAQGLGMTDSAVSHQLKILKDNKLIRGRRDGKSIFYNLADNHVVSILNQGLEHVAE